MKLNQLTFTRFITAFCILIFHAEPGVWPFGDPYLKQLFSNAFIGVSYFFILSGFVMVIAYGKNKDAKIDKSSYYLNRFARIYPVYLLALTLKIIISIHGHSLPLVPMLLNLGVIQAWFPGNVGQYNLPGWSLAVEALFYALFPLLFNHVYNKVSLKQVAVFTGVLWLVTQITFNYLWQSPFYKPYPSHSHDLLYYFPLMHLNQFLIGNIIGFIYFKMKDTPRNYDLAIIALVITSIALLSFKIPVNFHNGLMAVIFAPFILLMSLNNGRITRIFSGRTFVLLGEISYSMYIMQLPVKSLNSFLFKLMGVKNPNVIFYTYLPVLISISILCYFYVEIPAKNWIKAWRDKRHRPKNALADDTVNF